MKVFHCDHCDHLVFFENTQCVACGHTLAFLPDLMEIGSLEPSGDAWISPLPAASGRTYRLCQNYLQHGVCNWAVADEGHTLCEACRLTRVIPNLTVPGTIDAWARLELAKRRVVYTLKNLGLPITPRTDGNGIGLEFHFLADDPAGGAPVLTGHASGTITVNIAEADDAERERRRCALGEPYRTLLGHLRHETGHYYWDQFVEEAETLERFRSLFGDERTDYGEALARYYAEGPPADWRDRFVSAYAGAHPWEDWAETWAHYLHMVDALETAEAAGMEPRAAGLLFGAAWPFKKYDVYRQESFDSLMERWVPLTLALNSLSRSLGHRDFYPFVISATARAKLEFVHRLIRCGAL